MKIVKSLEALKRRPVPVMLAAGFFDGLHLGHQRVIGRALARARAVQGEAWVLTLDTHPLRVLNPPAAPRLLTANPHKLALLRRLGVAGCVLLPFDRQLAATEADAFAARIMACVPPVREVVVGRNWRYGRGGGGDAAHLARCGRAHGLRVRVVRPVTEHGETVSSTRVRAAIQAGRLDETARLLGRPFSLLGDVVHGKGLGHRLGFPTANLDPHNEVLPPRGVYAVIARLPGQARPRGGMLNLGWNPTVETSRPPRPAIEVHLFDFSGDLYGRAIEVFFIARVRGERRFPDLESLRRAIARDERVARSILDGASVRLG